MLSANAPKHNIPRPFATFISWNHYQTPTSLPRIPSLAAQAWLNRQPSSPLIDLQHFLSICVWVQSPVLSSEQRTGRRLTRIKFNEHKSIFILSIMLTLISAELGRVRDLGHFQTYSGFSIVSFNIETHEQVIYILWIKTMKRTVMSTIQRGRYAIRRFRAHLEREFSP